MSIADSATAPLAPLERRCLVYTIAFDQPGSQSVSQMAKMLIGSLLRTYFPGDIVVFRNRPEPLYLVERKGLREVFVETPDGLVGNKMLDWACAFKYNARHWLFPEAESKPEFEYSKIIFLDADCLVLRNLDHLLAGSEDVLVTEERGVPWTQPQFSTFLTDEELRSDPRSGINAGTWVVDASVYRDIMAEYERIDQSEAAQERKFSEQGAWNKLVWKQQKKYLKEEVLSTTASGGDSVVMAKGAKRWKVAKMETHEVRFPMHQHRDFKIYREAAVLHFLGGNAEEKLQLMFALYMAFFFNEKSGMFLNLLET